MAVVAVITAAGDTAASGILRAGLSMKSSRKEPSFPTRCAARTLLQQQYSMCGRVHKKGAGAMHSLL